jgi:hypothetical protein
MRTRLLYLLIGFALLGAFPATGQVEIGARLDSADIRIGDQVWLHMFLQFPVGTVIRKVDYSALENMEKVEVVATPPPDTVSRRPDFQLDYRFLITSFDSGYYQIPPIIVTFESPSGRDSVSTYSLGLNVNTLPVTPEDELRPIKGIWEEPLSVGDYLPWIIGLGSLIILILLGWIIARYTKKRPAPVLATPPPPPVGPDVIALEKLHELEQKDLVGQGRFKLYQSELTYIVREYLEAAFAMKALESTTREIQRDLRKKRIAPAWQDRLVELFQTADLVKFAKAEPPPAIHRQALEEARLFIKDTRPAARMVENPGEAQEV